MTTTLPKAPLPALQGFQSLFRSACRDHFDWFVVQTASSGRHFAQDSEVGVPRLPMELERRFLARKALLQSRFLERIDETFERLLDPARRQRNKGKLGRSKAPLDLAARISGLALMDDEQLEQQLLVNTAVKDLRAAYGAAIAELDLRLEHILCRRINPADSPGHPGVLIDAFVTCVREQDFSAADVRLLQKAFIDGLRQGFGPLLENCNGDLGARGVLPEIDGEEALLHDREMQEEEAARSRRQELLQTLVPERRGGADGVPAEALYRGLLKLLTDAAGMGLLERHGTAGTEVGEPIGDAELLAVLDELEALPLVDDEADYPPACEPATTLMEAINARLLTRKQVLPARKAASLSLVSLLFEDLTRNPDLAPQIRGLIAGLRVPFARAAVLDTDFFSDPDNAAQDLLNLLTRAGTTWSPAGNRRRDSLYNKMVSLVERVRREFRDDYHVFDACQEDFDLFLHAERRRAKLIEDRLIATERARVRTEAARDHAARHLAGRFPADLALPPPLAAFLGNEWKQALFFIHNRDQSPDSPAWREAIAVEDQFLAMLRQPRCTASADLESSLPRILTLVGHAPAEAARLARLVCDTFSTRSGHDSSPRQSDTLPTRDSVAPGDTLSASPDAGQGGEAPSARTTGDVGDTVRISIAQPSAAPRPVTPCPDVAPGPGSIDATPSDPPAPTGKPDANNDEAALLLLDRLSMGTWLQIEEEGQPPTKVRVAAYIRPTRTHVLVNRNGSKTGHYGHDQMLRLIREGRVRVIENTMLFERSLESVINHLRRR